MQKTIDVNIEELRHRLGWSLEDMARYFGVTGATVSRWQSGKSHPDSINRVLLLQLWNLTEQRDKEERRQKLGESLKGALLAGGIAGGLALLFHYLTEEEDEESSTDNP